MSRIGESNSRVSIIAGCLANSRSVQQVIAIIIIIIALF